MRRPIRGGAVTATVAALALVLTACGGGGDQGPAQTGQALSTTPAFNQQPYENVGGNTRITYTINPKAVYNDGTPIDWRAFEATWKANNATNDAYLVNSSDGYDRISSVTRGADDKQAVVNDRQNSTITFERNPRWWGRTGKLDRVTLVQMETAAKINAFRNGQIDAAEAETAEYLEQARSVPGADIRISGLPASYLMTLNSESPLLADPAARRAIMQGTDRKQIADITFQGLNYSEDPLGSLVNKPFQPGYQDNLTAAVAGGAAAAQQGLDAAGWVPGPDGVRTRNGQRLTVSYVQTGDTPTRRAVSGALVAMMKNIGVELTVRQVPSSDFAKVIANKEFDMLISGFRSSDPYGAVGICQLYCSDSQLNNSGTGTPQLDAELKQVPTKPTIQEQNAAANAAEKKALATFGLLPIYSGPEIWATRPGLANFGSGIFERALPETIGWQNGA